MVSSNSFNKDRCLTLILINVGLFTVILIFRLISDVPLADRLGLIGPFDSWIYRPWGLATYMFVQSDFLHLLFNMLWLWGFGELMYRMDGGKTLIGTYIISGLGGGLCFLTFTTLGHYQPSLITGASASVLGVIAGAATRNPRLPLNLFLFGEIQIRWIAVIAVILCGIAPAWGNYPTLSAHIGGIIAGWLYIYLTYRPRKQHRFSGKADRVRQHQKRGLSDREQMELDSLLDNVRQNGYKSLSAKKRARLFELSNKIKQ